MINDHAANSTRRGPKPRLSPDEVLDTALALANREGLTALNLRRLADELDVTPMTLYGYVENKDALLDGAIERAFPKPEPSPSPGEDWAEELRVIVNQIHDTLASNPGAIEMLMAGIQAPGLDHYREQVIAILTDAGFDDTASVQLLGMLLGYALGMAMVEGLRRRNEPDVARARYAELPEAEFPHLRRVAEQYTNRDDRASYAAGLEYLLEGLSSS